jgi:predicted PurR-regulated permease PerM
MQVERRGPTRWMVHLRPNSTYADRRERTRRESVHSRGRVRLLVGLRFPMPPRILWQTHPIELGIEPVVWPRGKGPLGPAESRGPSPSRPTTSMSVQVPQVIQLMPSTAPHSSNHGVPLRAIAAAIGMVLLTGLSLLFLYEVRRTLVWLVVALLFTVALYPVIGWVQRHLTRSHRLLATLLVFLLVLILIAGLITLFAIPLAREGALFVQQLPHLIEESKAGRGVIGRLLNRTNALHYLQENQDRIRAFLTGLTAPAARVFQTVATGVAGVITIFILALLMVLEGPKLVDGALNLVGDPQRRERIHQVGADCAKSITGYISGNLLISVICGGLIYAALKITGVPFAGLIAIFVAIADLVPLVGATLGAIVAVTAAAFHSIPALIVVAIFFVAYQQLENHVLQPLILSRTVKLDPLTVIVAILVGVELAGILGALLAIPFAGIIQVIVRDLWDHRKGGLKDEPTTGEEEVPITTEPPQSGLPGAGSHTSRRRLKAASSGRMAPSRSQRSRRRPRATSPLPGTQSASSRNVQP